MSSQTATILVTDLVASTQLRARLGEEQADRLRRLHDRLLRTSVETHGGVVVKGLGDGVLASFPEANGAIQGWLFSDDAPAFVEREQPAWKAWLENLPIPAA